MAGTTRGDNGELTPVRALAQSKVESQGVTSSAATTMERHRKRAKKATLPRKQWPADPDVAKDPLS